MSLQFNMSISTQVSESRIFRTPENSFSSEETESDSLGTLIENDIKFKLEKNLAFDSDPEQIPKCNYKLLATKLIDHANSFAAHKSSSMKYHWVIAENDCFLMTNIFLGKGSFGRVYQGFTHKGIPCAIKTGKINRDEIAFLRELSHPVSEKSSISQIIAADEGAEILVMELADANLGKTHYFLSHKDRLIIMRGVLYGLTETSKRNITHADLKPDNILVMKRADYYATKIGDFGLSTNSPQTYAGGSPWYNPPEFYRHMLGSNIESEDLPKVDVWAAMITFAEIGWTMLSPNFQQTIQELSSDFKDIKKNCSSKVEFRENMFKYFAKYEARSQRSLFAHEPVTPLDKLLKPMSALNPQNRLSAGEALNLFDGLFTPKPDMSEDLSLNCEGEMEDSNFESPNLSPDQSQKKIASENIHSLTFDSERSSSLFVSVDLNATASLNSEARSSSGFELLSFTPTQW